MASQNNVHPSRNNNIWEFSVQQSRVDIETRTPTTWGEARTFLAFDWAGCDNFSCLSLQQGGGDSLHPRLRFAYGTLGGFLAGQALSNFSDADADTEFDGFRWRDWLDRRSTYPAGAIYGSRSVWQRILRVGGKSLDRGYNPGWRPII